MRRRCSGHLPPLDDWICDETVLLRWRLLRNEDRLHLGEVKKKVAPSASDVNMIEWTGANKNREKHGIFSPKNCYRT